MGWGIQEWWGYDWQLVWAHERGNVDILSPNYVWEFMSGIILKFDWNPFHKVMKFWWKYFFPKLKRECDQLILQKIVLMKSVSGLRHFRRRKFPVILVNIIKVWMAANQYPIVLLGPFSYQRYEDMKDEFETVIKEVATFLGKEVTTQ